MKVENHKHFDQVFFNGGGVVAFVYHKDKNQLLDKAAFGKSMQAGLKVSSAYYETIKRRLIAFGVEKYKPPYPVNENQNYYFHASVGQVFRLVKKSKKDLMYTSPME